MNFVAEKLTRPPRIVLWLSIVVLVFFMIVAWGLMVVPWRQTVFGTGKVSVFNPMDRPQPVDAQVKGRLVKLSVVEGQMVKKGDLIAVLEDRDTKYLDPERIQRIRQQIVALREKQAATQDELVALRGQREALRDAVAAAVPSAEAKAVQAAQKTDVLKQQIRLAEQDILTAKLQKDRTEQLFADGLKSERELELAVQKLVETETKLQKLEGDIEVAGTEIEIAQFERGKIAAELAEKQQKIAENIAKGQGTLAETEEKIRKLQGEEAAFEIRDQLQRVYAPMDGMVTNLKKVGPGHMIKEGDTLANLVPPHQALGVELYVRGLDSPLVEVGRPVRLLFEGFPAVPFAGWPWAAVGTFGGTITVVDPMVSEEEKDGFRVWVMPDPAQPAWPSDDRLRIGSKASGFIMLDDVPLYYEVWRQLNAFPARPALESPTDKIKTKPVLRR